MKMYRFIDPQNGEVLLSAELLTAILASDSDGLEAEAINATTATLDINGLVPTTVGGAGGSVAEKAAAGAAGAATTAGGAGGTVINVAGAGGAKADTGTAAGGAGGNAGSTAGAGGNTAGAGVSAGGAGGDLINTAGNGGNATAGTGNGGAGGSVRNIPGTGGTSAGGTAGVDGGVINEGKVFDVQAAPAAKTVTATLTAAEVMTGMITANQGAGAGATYTFPAGADLAALWPSEAGTGYAFMLYCTNESTVAAEDVTFQGGTGTTLRGSGAMASNAAATDKSNAIFRIRRTGAATFDIFRVG